MYRSETATLLRAKLGHRSGGCGTAHYQGRWFPTTEVRIRAATSPRILTHDYGHVI
jgi:hypothetical protein